MNEDNPIHSLLVWRQTLAARIRANDPTVVDPNISAQGREKVVDVLDGVLPSLAGPPNSGEAKTMNDTERGHDRLLAILESHAHELGEKAALIRSVGKQLIASAAAQSESDYPVEWSARSARCGQSLEIELAVQGQCLDVRLRDVRSGYVIKPRFTEEAQGEDSPF